MNRSRLPRREFLGAMLTGAGSLIAVPIAGRQSPPAAPRGVRLSSGPGQSRTLKAEDFRYLGAFQLPRTGEGDSGYANGLTHRYVNGEFRLFSAYWRGNPLTEFMPPPGLSTNEPFAMGITVRKWGSDWHDSKLWGQVFGLHWDEEDGRLYWNCGSSYIAARHTTSFGYSVLNEATGTATARGPFGVPSPPNYKAIKGMTAIPPAFQKPLGGKRIAAGFGGGESVVAAGPSSLGPTLMPFDHRVLPDVREGRDLPASAVQLLMNHPHHTHTYHEPLRAVRNPHYAVGGGINQWPPKDGVGYWTPHDFLRQSAVWIDTGSRQGFLVFVRQVMGGERAEYESRRQLGRLNYLFALRRPLDNLRRGDLIAVPDSTDGIYSHVAGRVEAFSDTSITAELLTGNPIPTPVPKANGVLYRGSFYFNATIFTTEGRLAAFIYDSNTILSGLRTDQVPPAEESHWKIPTQPDRMPSGSDFTRGGVTGATYDPATRRLYLLIQKATSGRGSNAVIFVWEVSE